MPFQVRDTSLARQPKVPAMAALGLDALSEGTTPSNSDAVELTNVTASEIETMVLFLRRARDRASTIRDNAPAGSYLDSVLKRTIHGIDQEVSQLNYLLAKRDMPDRPQARMRPAI